MSSHPFQQSLDVLMRVRQCAASVTRYPIDILTADAQLEDELGIDSVKLAEIAAVVGREFNLPPERLPKGGKARTLGAMAEVVARLLADASAPPPAAPVAVAPSRSAASAAMPAPAASAVSAVSVATPAPVASVASVVTPAPATSVVSVATPAPAASAVSVASPAAPSGAVSVANPGASSAPAVGDLETRVRAVFARVTRYPEELLTPNADLEDELGIDSVKQAEVLAVLVKELGLADGPKPSQRLRTLAAICEAVRAAQEMKSPAPVASPSREASAPAPVAARPELPFAGRIALVTGSGKGIGKVIAQRLARAGATVVVNSFHSRDEGERTAQEILAEGGRALHLWGSVAQEEHLERMFRAIAEQLGGLDFLVCNASNGLIGPFDRITPRDWDKAFRTCITGTYECAMRARPLMAKRGGGSIVTMSTSMSQRYMHDLGCQGVVKAGVESLTRYLAAELAPEGIRTNCVSAGPVHGELLGMFPDAAGRVARWEAATPGGQLCTAEDVADVTELLLGSKTQRVNGAIWVVDGGLSGTVDGLLPDGTTKQPHVNGASHRHMNGHDVRALLALDA